MFGTILLATVLVTQTASPAAPQEPTPTVSSASAAKATDADESIEKRLLKVKRIYVESFGDDPISKQIQAMVITSLTDSKKLIVTENKERADAILKGSGLEKTSQELHSYSESTAAGGGGGSFAAGSGGFVAHGASINDAATHTETINDARVAVRLIDRDGDVIWTTTQESKGGKYKGATADVADMVVKQLIRDMEKASRQAAPPSSPSK